MMLTIKKNDSFGYLMDLIYQYYRLMPGTLDEIEDMWEMVKSILSTVMEDWKKPDKGIWEIRGEKPPFCFIQSDVLGGFGPWCKDSFHAGYSERWQKEADKVWQDVMTYGWKEELQSFSQTYDNMAMDSSLLLMEPYGFIASRRYPIPSEGCEKALCIRIDVPV